MYVSVHEGLYCQMTAGDISHISHVLASATYEGLNSVNAQITKNLLVEIKTIINIYTN